MHKQQNYSQPPLTSYAGSKCGWTSTYYVQEKSNIKMKPHSIISTDKYYYVSLTVLNKQNLKQYILTRTLVHSS